MEVNWMDNSKRDFQEIYAGFQPKILRYLTNLVGEGEAEDLTQEVFIKVHRALEDFRGEAQLSTWLYRIATNAALDKFRSPSFQRDAQLRLSDDPIEKDEGGIDDRVICLQEKKPLIEQQLVRKEMNDCIRGFIEKLPDEFWTVLVLSEFEGLKDKEIAEILGITPATVKIRLHRAKAKLAGEFETHCGLYWIENNEFIPDLKSVLVGQ
jgi:RNA polymerase sigma-70 factor (ECF subfamily)